MVFCEHRNETKRYEFPVLPQVGPSATCDAQSDTDSVFLSEYFMFPLSAPFYLLQYSFISHLPCIVLANVNVVQLPWCSR